MELAISSSPQLPSLDASLPIYQRDLLGQLMKVKLPAPGAFDEYLSNAYRDYLGWHTRPEICALAPTGNKLKKIVVANDFHCPFQHEGALARLLEEAHDTDLLFINGDLADMWSFSRWAKLRKISNPLHDFRETQKILNLLASRFRKIKMLEGNHDSRTWKYMADLLPPEVLEYLEEVAPDSLHPMQKLVRELPNVELVAPYRTGYAEYSFIHQIGDCIMSHAEVFSSIPNQAVNKVIHWLNSYAVPKKIVKPFRIVIQAHTHQAGKTIANGNIVAIENASMTHTPEYQGSAKIQSPRPSAVGYSVLWQDENGRTDINKTNFVLFEEETEPVLCPSY